MKCNECQNLINAYIDHKLIGKELDEFIMHVHSCSECMEELSVNYSILTALNQIDNGIDLSEDYDAELNSEIKAHLDKKKRKRIIYNLSVAFAFLVSIFVGILLSFFIWQNNGPVYGNEDNITLKIDGVPTYMDKVESSIHKYNTDIIDYLHERNTHE